MKVLNSYKDVTFSTNLVGQAVHHVNFLKEIDRTNAHYSPSLLRQALYRYEKYWLPLAKDYLSECLSAPIDIEWMWHCHMLRPKKYIDDCETIVGHLINHTLRSQKDYATAQKRSKALWEKKYLDIPFNLDINNGSIDESEIAGFQSQLTYDVIAAAGRQKEFYYNVSLPHYKDPAFLQKGQERYQKMIFLKQEAPDQYLIPCYDNDLIWHTHQLNPWNYQKDMLRLFGEIFDHDDSTDDRSEGSKLTNSYAETIELWRETFNERLQQPGAMYRGQQPGGILHQMSKDDIFCLATKKTTVSIDLVLKIFGECGGKVFILTNGYGGVKKLTSFNKTEQIPYSPEMNFKTQHFHFDTRYTNHVKFEIVNKNGGLNDIGEPALDLIPFIEADSIHNGGTFQRALQLKEGGGLLEIKGRFSTPKQGNILFFIERGNYEPGTIPVNIREEWGPVHIDRLGPGVDSQCIIANHKLRNHVGRKDMTARVIHCPTICQSFVQVFLKNKMVVVTHFIGTDQLPIPALISRPAVTLDPKLEERAMLIKNHEGDWGIVTAKWLKSKKPATEKGPPGSDGALHVKVYQLSSAKVSSCQVGYTNQTFNFQVNSLKADFQKGTIEIDKDSTVIAENIAVALSIAILRDRCVSSHR